MSGKRSCASSSRESIAMGQIARQPAKVIRCCDAPCGDGGDGWELCHKPTVITGEACTSSSKGRAAGRVWGPRETGAPAFYAFCRTLTLSHPRSNPLRGTTARFASARNEHWPGDIEKSLRSLRSRTYRRVCTAAHFGPIATGSVFRAGQRRRLCLLALRTVLSDCYVHLHGHATGSSLLDDAALSNMRRTGSTA